jgi:hypothetical protein
MKTDSLVIWQDTPVQIKHKCVHIHKINGKVHKDFCIDNGDLPVAVINGITGKWEPVDNRRGMGYSARKRLKYRRNKKKDF